MSCAPLRRLRDSSQPLARPCRQPHRQHGHAACPASAAICPNTPHRATHLHISRGAAHRRHVGLPSAVQPGRCSYYGPHTAHTPIQLRMILVLQLTAFMLASPVLCSPMTTHMFCSLTLRSAMWAHAGTLAAISICLQGQAGTGDEVIHCCVPHNMHWAPAQALWRPSASACRVPNTTAGEHVVVRD